MHRVAKLLKYSAFMAMVLLLVFEGLPVTRQYRDNIQIFQDGDDILGTGNTYFAISPGGTLVGWGSNHLNRIGGFLPYYPYFARKVIVDDAAAFSCGSSAVMYIDKDHILWGWGTNNELIFSEDILISKERKQIMEEVSDIAVGFHHAAAIKTDGSLWTWGQNKYGELGNGSKDVLNGVILNNGKYYAPQKIMENMKKVKIIDGITFAISDSNTLFVWGADDICEPIMIAEDVKDVAYLGNNTLYQYLDYDGNVFLIDAVLIANREHERIAENVHSLCKGGVVKNDSTLWSWVCEEGKNELIKENDNAWVAIDKGHYITSGGRLYLNAGSDPLPTILRSTYTVVPFLRNIFVLFSATYIILLRKKNSKASEVTAL